ncbi:MAG TPA: hypothetical protein VLV86_25630 [Vicinamibacterales bacterium]|nr:hypothetical protein [Vicinamibacterales bacterium]
MADVTRSFGILVAGALLFAPGQWLNYPTPGTPRGVGGRPNLSAKVPRASDGKPDLSGVWRTAYDSPEENARLFGPGVKAFVEPGDDPSSFSKYFLDILVDFPRDRSPMRPAATEMFRQNAARKSASSSANCLPQGLPRTDINSYAPFKIIQTSGVIAVLYEVDNTHRQIYTDGRPLPLDPQPAWGGYSVGRWDGETLIVDAAGFNDRTWLDSGGHPHSDGLRIQERFHRRDFGHMDLTVTVDDPKMYTQPFTIKVTEMLLPDTDILESVCNENEKDRARMDK